MRQLLFCIAGIFFTISSFGQFADTTQLNAYIRDTIRDRRPEKVTAAQIQKALLGTTQFLTPDPGNVSGTGTANRLAYWTGGSAIDSLAAGTSGQVLTSAGSSGPPVWQAPTPATAVEAAITGGTTGSLLFVGSGPVIQQDNANLFWDNSGKRLSVGTNTPASNTVFTVNGTSGNASASFRDNTNADRFVIFTNGVVQHTTSAFTASRTVYDLIGSTYNPGSGAGSPIWMRIRPTYNTTGTYAGTGVGYDYDPVLTSTTGLTHIAYRATSGSVVFGTTTPLARFHVRGVGSSGGTLMRLENAAGTAHTTVLDNGQVVSTSNTPVSGGVASGTTTVRTFTTDLSGASSGTSATTALLVNGTLNTTGTFSGGTYMGYSYNPTLTSLTGLNHYALYSTSGSVALLNSSSDTPSNNSTRLDIRTNGTGSTSIGLRVATNANNDILRVIGDGGIRIGNAGSPPLMGAATTGALNNGGRGIAFGVGGEDLGLTVNAPISRSSGSTTGASINIPSTINNTGTYSGIVYGVNYDPVLTSVTGTTHVAWRNTSGSVLMGTTSLASTDTRLQVRGIGNSTGTTARFESNSAIINAIWFDDGTIRMAPASGGSVIIGNTTSNPTTNTRVDIRGIGTGTTTALRVANSSNQEVLTIRDDGQFIVSPAGTTRFQTSAVGTSISDVVQSGNTNLLSLTTAAHTGAIHKVLNVSTGNYSGVTASAENSDVDFDLSHSITWASGGIATQRAFRIRNPTYAFTGSSTITEAATLAIDGAPVAGTNATITNSYGLTVGGGVKFSSLTQDDAQTRIMATDSNGKIFWRAASSIGGSGTIAGSTGSTDNRVLRADGTGGSTVQSSSVTISDAGVITTPGLNISSTPTNDNTETAILVRQSDGEIQTRTVSSLGGISGTVSGSDVPYGNGTNTITSSSQFEYHPGTRTLEVNNLSLVDHSADGLNNIQSDQQLNISAEGLILVTTGGGIVLDANGHGNIELNGGLVTVGSGINGDGTGMKHKRVSTGSIPGTSSDQVTITWNTPFGNTNYTCSITVEDSGGILRVGSIISKTASAVVVGIFNDDVSSGSGTVHAIAIHD